MEFEENNDDPWMHKTVMMNFKTPSIYFQFKRRENKNNVISMQVLQVEKQNKTKTPLCVTGTKVLVLLKKHSKNRECLLNTNVTIKYLHSVQKAEGGDWFKKKKKNWWPFAVWGERPQPNSPEWLSMTLSSLDHYPLLS